MLEFDSRLKCVLSLPPTRVLLFSSQSIRSTNNGNSEVLVSVRVWSEVLHHVSASCSLLQMYYRARLLYRLCIAQTEHYWWEEPGYSWLVCLAFCLSLPSCWNTCTHQTKPLTKCCSVWRRVGWKHSRMGGCRPWGRWGWYEIASSGVGSLEGSGLSWPAALSAVYCTDKTLLKREEKEVRLGSQYVALPCREDRFHFYLRHDATQHGATGQCDILWIQPSYKFQKVTKLQNKHMFLVVQ